MTTETKWHLAACMFPMPDDDAINALADDIAKNGQEVPIIVMPDGAILDGRCRSLACKIAGVEPRTETYTGDDPVGYSLSLNLHRRHLSSSQSAMVAAKAEDVVATLSAEAKQRQREAGAQYGENHPKEVRQEIAEALPVPDENKTVAKAAKLFGTNRTYVNQAKRLIEEAPDLAEQVERGELKITQAASTLRKRKSEEISADRQQQQAESWKVDTYGSVEELRMTGKTFDVIYADPPWRYGNQATRAATDNHYPTMTVEEIAELPVRDISNDKSLLFLWTTNGFLFESRLVIESWGFTFKSSMVWVKPQIGIGNYVRNSHEFLLICSRGGAIPNGSSQISWLECNRTKHSKKPDQFRIVIEQMTKGSSRVELFGREVFEGWITVGNQIERNLIHAG